MVYGRSRDHYQGVESNAVIFGVYLCHPRTLEVKTIIDSSSVPCVDLQNLQIRRTTKLPFVSGNRPGRCYCVRMKGVQSLCFVNNINVLSTTL